MEALTWPLRGSPRGIQAKGQGALGSEGAEEKSDARPFLRRSRTR